MCKLPVDFYQNANVLTVSKALLGKVLVTNLHDKLTSGIIVETEAYRAPEDKASHAYNNKRTKRTETMFAAGGVAYVYLCYGMHHLFNIVSGPKDTAHAILIRAIEPLDGIDIMLKRRNLSKFKTNLTAGPGVLTQALGISTKHNGVSLCDQQIWVEDRGIHIAPKQIQAASRVGIAYAEEFVTLPWRFYLKGNPWVSTFNARKQTITEARAPAAEKVK